MGESGLEIYRKAVDADVGDALLRLDRCGADTEIISLAKRCLSVNREDRFRDSSALTKELTGYLHSVEERLKQAELTAVQAKTKAEEETKRRRITFRLAAAILLTLVAGLVGSLWQMKRAMDAETLAKDNEGKAERAREAEQLRAEGEKLAKQDAQKANNLTAERLKQIQLINNSVFDIFSEFDIRKMKERRDPFEHLLTKKLIEAGRKLDAKAIQDPLVLASLRNRLGQTLLSLGEAPAAIEMLTSAREIRSVQLGHDDPTTLVSMINLAASYRAAGKLGQALPLYEETLKLMKTKLGQDHTDTLYCMNSLAMGYQDIGKLSQALPLFEETVKLMKVKLGPDHPDTLTTINNLAVGYREAGKINLALSLSEDTLKLMKAKLGHDHPDTLTSMTNLAEGYQAAGKLNLALPLAEETLRLKKSKLGPDHPDTLISMGNLALVYQSAGKHDLALPLFEETHRLTKVKQGPDHPDTLNSMNNLAGAYQTLGNLDKALPLFEETLKLMKTILGPDHPDTLNCTGNLGGAYCRAKQGTKAAPLLKEFVAARRRQSPKNDRGFAGMLAQVSLDLLKCEQFGLAEEMLRESLAIREKMELDKWTTFNTQSLLGGACLSQKKLDEAEPLLIKGYEGMKQRVNTIPPQGQIRLSEALDRLIQFYTETNKPNELKKWQAERDKMPKSQEKKP